jgi:excisionase family DNA binding protein
MLVKSIKKYYSTSECAEILKVSRITIFNWIQKKKIKAEKYAGNYMISSDQIDELQSHRDLREEEKKGLRVFASRLLTEYGEFLRAID